MWLLGWCFFFLTFDTVLKNFLLCESLHLVFFGDLARYFLIGLGDTAGF